jgi:hypothetical protein
LAGALFPLLHRSCRILDEVTPKIRAGAVRLITLPAAVSRVATAGATCSRSWSGRSRATGRDIVASPRATSIERSRNSRGIAAGGTRLSQRGMDPATLGERSLGFSCE